MAKSPTKFLSESLGHDDIIHNIPKEIMNSELLYRSFYKSYSSLRDFGKTQTRKGRVPVDTPIEIHNMFDEMFEKKFGLKPRSQSLFCSKSLKVARNYADNVDDVYIVIPLGNNLKYAYSKKILDFFHAIVDETFDELCEKWDVFPSVTVGESLNAIAKKDKKTFKKILPDIEKIVQKMVNSYVVTTELSQVPKIGEVMVLCDEFYYINLMQIDEDEVRTYRDLLS